MYEEDWFIKKAIISLKKVSKSEWDYSDSSLLYSKQGEESYSESNFKETEYYKYVVLPEVNHLNDIMSDLNNNLPDKFNLIDLGPGNNKKAEIFFKNINLRNRILTYIPVDISKVFLENSKKVAENYSLPVQTVNSTFEEYSNNSIQGVNLVILTGITFANYDQEKILNLLLKIAGESGYIFFNVQLYDKNTIEELKNIYLESTKNACDQKIRFLGLDSYTDISKIEINNEMSIFYTIRKSNEQLTKIGIMPNARLKIFQSKRFDKRLLMDQLQAYRPIIFDTRSSVISFLIKVN